MAKTCLAVDGDNLLHRAYHVAKLREPFDMGIALATFTRSLNSAIREHEHSHLFITWDASGVGGTFRHEIMRKHELVYKDREHDAGVYRFKILCQQMCNVLSIKQFTSTQGFEGDDILGHLSRMFTEEVDDFHVHILTSDKDLVQMVSESVSILNPKRGFIDMYNCKEVMGVEAKNMMAYLILVGDSADCVPGIKGIGPKTAISMLEEYGSVKGILDNVKSLPPRFQKIFKEKDHLPFPVLKKLIQLREDSVDEFLVEFGVRDLIKQSSLKRLRKNNESNVDRIIKHLNAIHPTFGDKAKYFELGVEAPVVWKE